MPRAIFEALTCAAKTGFITKDLWAKHFASGRQRWANRQLRDLITKGYLTVHPNPIATKCFLSTKKGRDLVCTNTGLSCSTPVVQQIAHDEFVASSMISLLRDNIIADWLCEIELKQLKLSDWVLERSREKTKYPDAIITLRSSNLIYQCAFEYERSEKGQTRYRNILSRYEKLNSLWMILFVCETRSIQESIKSQLTKFNSPRLSTRLATVLASDWKLDPANASLEIGATRFSFNDLRTLMTKRSDPKDSPEDSP